MADVGPIHIHDLTDFIKELLVAAGAGETEAELVAGHVVDAEAHGKRSQGLVRVIPYATWAREGKIAPNTELTVEQDSGSTIVVDANHGWGHVAASRTMDLCMERASETGVCLAVIRNTNHIGRLGYYVEAAAKRNMISLIAASGNPNSAWVAPWGGIKPLFGTNPIAIGFPRRNGPPIVVDISTTQTARGTVLMAQKLGEQLGEGLAFDGNGNPTQDPHQALPPHGTLAPLGGHKGYALALAVEILCGVLAGLWPPKPSANLIGAIKIEAFLPLETYYQSLSNLVETIKGISPKAGVEEVLLPGEGSARQKAISATEGLRIPSELWTDVIELADELGVAHPVLDAFVKER